MGSLVGKVSEEQPKYTVVEDAGAYQVRRYNGMVVARTATEGNDSQAFRRLAAYIGVLSEPANTARAPIAMTAPVLSAPGGGEKIAMTAPVLNNSGFMAFPLPASRFSSAAEAPVPTDPAVEVVDTPAEVFAVETFTWRATEAEGQRRGAALAEAVAANPRFTVADGPDIRLARYNPPWTLPFMRTNEVLVRVEEATS